MKIKLSEINLLAAEISGANGLLLKELPFALKFRIETKIIPFLKEAQKFIQSETSALALKNGAKACEKTDWEFELGEDGKVINEEGFANFQNDFKSFMLDEENEIEIEHTLKLAAFGNISIGEHYPIICKITEE